MNQLSRLVINARHLSQEMTGVQRFAHEISKQLALSIEDVTFVAPPGRLHEAAYPVTQIGRRTGHFWEQIELPAYLSRQGSPLLLNLMSTAPVLYQNQIMSHHDITYVRHPESFSRRFRVLYGVLTPLALRASRAVITVSEFSKQEITSHYHISPDKLHVIPNAVTSIFQPENEKTREPFFLAVSSPNKHKNFERLVEAFIRADLPPEFKLKIVGSQATSFSKQLSLSSNARVQLLGRVGDTELVDIYRRATAFAFPSLYEGFGIPPLEAQAVGTPVLASNAPAVLEALRDTALYFDPEDTEQIVRAFERMGSNEDLRRELASKGRENASRFSWVGSANDVAQLIDELRRSK